MTVDEFVRQPRGPALFDTHQHPEGVPSIYGDFVVEFHTDIDVPPSPEMAARANELVEQFKVDAAFLGDLIFREYQSYCADAGGVGDEGVKPGKSIHEIGDYLEAKSLVVFDDLLASIYMSPAWDREHGLYFDWIDGSWVMNT